MRRGDKPPQPDGEGLDTARATAEAVMRGMREAVRRGQQVLQQGMQGRSRAANVAGLEGLLLDLPILRQARRGEGDKRPAA